MLLHLSGGTSGACNGQFIEDWNAYQLSHPGALGSPWSSGDDVWAQAWFRDPLACKASALVPSASPDLPVNW
jgi:hypothetical protein